MALYRGTPVKWEPKKENRFYLEFPSELGIETWLVMSTKRPSKTTNAVPIPYFDGETYVAGKVKYGAMDIKFLDLISPASGQKVMEWVRSQHEALTNRTGYAEGYKKTIMLKDADPVGVEIGKFVLFDCMITSVDFGNNDHGSDALQMVTLQIQPDYWEMVY